jgi:tRNA threonylcarbamoyladenosine biosynthesis protein TsaB
MALIVNLETATTNCSVTVARDGKTVSVREHNSASYSHSEQLHNFIKEALEEASLSFSDLDAIAVSKGPGSYTGLRIGVSAAKGLCFALDLPLISTPTLYCMALQKKVVSGIIIPLLDARRMEVYAGVFDASYTELVPAKAVIIQEDTFLEFAEQEKVFLIGSGAEKCKDILQHPNFIFDPSIVPTATTMSQHSFEKFLSSDFENVAYFEPYYLKDFILQQKKA